MYVHLKVSGMIPLLSLLFYLNDAVCMSMCFWGDKNIKLTNCKSGKSVINNSPLLYMWINCNRNWVPFQFLSKSYKTTSEARVSHESKFPFEGGKEMKSIHISFLCSFCTRKPDLVGRWMRFWILAKDTRSIHIDKLLDFRDNCNKKVKTNPGNIWCAT